MTEKKICFVALGSLSLLTSNEKIKYAGGSEITHVLIGRELAKRGYEISFIAYGEKNEKNKVDNITIIKNLSQYNNFSRFKASLMLWKSLKEANADIYFQGSGPAAIIPFFCIIHKKKYIKWIVSDSNLLVDRLCNNSHPLLLKISIFLDIKFAHKIIVQNLFQKEIVERKFNKKCVLIKNPIIISNRNNFIYNKNIILWVSTIRPVKQPYIFLKISELLPQYRFIMIGGKSEKERDLYDKIKEKSLTIPNLQFLGFVPHHKIQKYYEEASIFINTSEIEGFPNTFLEAWMYYTPVISLNVDPDEVICKEKLGMHSKTFDKIIQDINNLMSENDLRKEMGVNARKYVEQNHDVKKIGDQFEELIKSFKNFHIF